LWFFFLYCPPPPRLPLFSAQGFGQLQGWALSITGCHRSLIAHFGSITFFGSPTGPRPRCNSFCLEDSFCFKAWQPCATFFTGPFGRVLFFRIPLDKSPDLWKGIRHPFHPPRLSFPPPRIWAGPQLFLLFFFEDCSFWLLTKHPDRRSTAFFPTVPLSPFPPFLVTASCACA